MRSRHLSCIAALVVLAGCTGRESAPAGGSGTGGTLIVAQAGEPTQLIPPLVGDIAGAAIQAMVFDHLAELGASMNTIGDKDFQPRLAKSWTWSKDSLSIAFSIDPRAKWHDGQPITAQDFKYSLQLFTDPKVGSPQATLFANVDSLQVRDSLTVVAWFKTRRPSQFFDFVNNLIAVPQHVYGSIPLEELHTSERARTIVGSGQFKLVKWEPKVRIEMIADTAHYRGRPKLDRIIMAFITDGNAGVTQVLTGQADFLSAYPIDQLKQLDSSKVARPLIIPNLGYTYAAFNPRAPKSKAPHPIFSDIRVRRALAMGVDRVGMLKNVYGQFGLLGHGPFPMRHPAADSTIQQPSYDTTAAKAMLDSSGWKVGPKGTREKNGQPFHIRMLSSTSSVTRKQYATLLQEQFRRLGIEAEIELLDQQTYDPHARAGDWDLLLWSWTTEPSINGFAQTWSTLATGPGGQNVQGYSNKKVDALLDSASLAFDPAKGDALAHRAFETISNDIPAIWLYDVVLIDAVHRRVNVGVTRPDGWYVDMGSWSIDPTKQIDRDKIGLTAR
ncbi:MAG TPA: peptide ABC transporter substrate-binding protein [Gemmatimonadaceae bacterium]|jgi:peptide/nickel transport system substrate-binding protein